MAHPNPRDWLTSSPRFRPLWYSVALTAITILGLAVRLIGYARYSGLIYDEFYYVPAADVLLRRPPIATVKNMVPGIDPNLLSHPPLTKEFIAASIYLLGQHPWVWRLPALLFGAAVPLMVAGIAWELFGRRVITVVAAGLAAVDGLLVVMSRVALPDSPAVAFVVGALWALVTITQRLKRGDRVSVWRWIGLGSLLGLGLASEWIGGQAILMAWIWLLVSHPSARRAYRRWVPATTLLPLVLYYASYFYAWPSGYHESWLPSDPFIAFFKLQWLMLKGMWTLRFFHPWTANVWTWLGLPRPTAMILSLTSDQSIRVMAFPDPVIIWVGLASLVVGIWIVRREPRLRVAWAFLGIWFLCFYATWLATPRSKFLYYFATASVGLDIAAAAGLVLLWQVVRHRAMLQGVVAELSGGVALSVLYLMPLWVGLALPRPFYHALWWPPNWNARVSPAAASSQPSFSLTMNPVRQSVRAWDGISVPSPLTPLPVAWTTFRGAVSHNTVYDVAGRLKSGYALTLATAGLSEAPAVVGSTAYVGTNNNQLYAVNLKTGDIAWAVGVPNEVESTPLVDRGLVVVGLGNNVFSRFRQSTGWIRGTGVSGLMAFNATTGIDQWFAATSGEAMASPVIQGHTVYDVTGSSRLVAFSLTSGKRLWSLKMGGFDSLSSPIIVGDHLYVATNSYFSSYPAKRSTVWSINLDTHQVSWQRNLPVASGLSDCSLADDAGRLFVAGVPRVSNRGKGHTVSQRVFALNQLTGRVVWSRSLGRGHVSALNETEEGIPLAINGVVYEGSPASNRVEAFNAATGRHLWTRRLSAGITANPVLVGHTLIVATMGGRLIQLSATTGRVMQQDPYSFGLIGSASPLIVSHILIQSTLLGQLVVQRLGG